MYNQIPGIIRIAALAIVLVAFFSSKSVTELGEAVVPCIKKMVQASEKDIKDNKTPTECSFKQASEKNN